MSKLIKRVCELNLQETIEETVGVALLKKSDNYSINCLFCIKLKYYKNSTQ